MSQVAAIIECPYGSINCAQSWVWVESWRLSRNLTIIRCLHFLGCNYFWLLFISLHSPALPTTSKQCPFITMFCRNFKFNILQAENMIFLSYRAWLRISISFPIPVHPMSRVMNLKVSSNSLFILCFANNCSDNGDIKTLRQVRCLLNFVSYPYCHIHFLNSGIIHLGRQ